MTLNGAVQIALFFVVLVALVKPLGAYMARVYQGRPILIDRLLGPVERLIYLVCGVQPAEEMRWTTYTIAFLVFSAVGLLVVYALQRVQGLLPLNPQNLGAVSPDLALNTAASFATNTNWQAYGGETTMSYLTQMLGMTVQNFVSAAAGMAVLVAFIRGFVRHSSETIGNFWVDLTRTTLYILLPLSLLLAIFLVSQGVVQTFGDYRTANVLQPGSYQQPKTDAQGNAIRDAAGHAVIVTLPLTQQVLAIGPAASQIAIKQLGTNGGGFFNANSAHPYENPTPLSNLLEMLAILLIPAALTYTFGVMVGDTRQGWALLVAMLIIFAVLLVPAVAAEQGGNPLLATATVSQTAVVDQSPGASQAGGNMEGKEVRFGIAPSALWETATTAASNGSVNSMHDSYSPLGGLVALVMMHLGEVVFGGAGSGLYGLLAFVIVAVFVAGLMVGRTPEYLGKKIEVYEIKMASLLILIMPIIVLAFTALATVTAAGKAGPLNPGPHGFSEILYAFTSLGNNNGSAFAGLNANTPFYNLTGSLAMLLSRFWLAIPTLALAGSLARKKHVPAGAGTLPTYKPMFVGWLIGVVLLVGALNFVPALALGPIVEHLMLFARQGS
jgi:potassium-transporting ATPase potassium-binding subunit